MEDIYNSFAAPGTNMDDWISKFKSIKIENADNTFITDAQIAQMVNAEYDNQENTQQTYYLTKIADLLPGLDDAQIEATIMSISSPREFISRKGKKMSLQKMRVSDDSAAFDITVWYNDITTFQEIVEEYDLQPGDLVQITGLNTSEYQGEINASWSRKTKLTLIEKEYEDVLQPITQIMDIDEEGTYRIEGIVVFVGEPQIVGQNKTLLQKIVVTDDWEHEIEICIWRDTTSIIAGDKIQAYIDVTRYKDQLNYNLNTNYQINTLKHTRIKMERKKLAEIEQLQNYDKVNTAGTVIRRYNDVPYDRGYITTWVLQLEDDNIIDFTMFGETGKHYNCGVGDVVQIYKANKDFDAYTLQPKLNHGYDTLIHIIPMENVSIEFTPLAEISKYADEDEYFDINAYVLKKQASYPYQKMDNTSSTITRGELADDTSIVDMVIWGGQQILLQYGLQYHIYNVKAKENENTGQTEIHIDNRTRIEETPLTINLNNHYQPVDKLKDDLLTENVQITGELSTLTINEYPRCPTCNSKLTETMTGHYCEQCKHETIPKYLWKAQTTINNQHITLWGDVAETLIVPHVDQAIDIQDQLEPILNRINQNPPTIYGTVDYDEKQNIIYLNATDVGGI